MLSNRIHVVGLDILIFSREIPIENGINEVLIRIELFEISDSTWCNEWLHQVGGLDQVRYSSLQYVWSIACDIQSMKDKINLGVTDALHRTESEVENPKPGRLFEINRRYRAEFSESVDPEAIARERIRRVSNNLTGRQSHSSVLSCFDKIWVSRLMVRVCEDNFFWTASDSSLYIDASIYSY
jgi:hypothetical protein